MKSKPVVVWLVCICALILLMVAVGGITRLTESGLSMVDWKPLMGVIPPLNEEAWKSTFDRYKAYPEYRRLKPDMTLSEFKAIFFWEYLHRLLGRLLGVCFFAPWLYFGLRGYLTRALAARLGVAFVLGGLQGVWGWYMVQSGLVDNPYVSHYRLAVHLGLAFVLFAYLLWIILSLLHPGPEQRAVGVNKSLKRFSLYIMGALFLQIVYGAFVAGLNAGYMFNTFPKMLGRWLPPGLLDLEPVWMNLVQNAATVQFIHRALAWGLLLGVMAFWGYAKRFDLGRKPKMAIHAMVGLLGLQFVLGVMTLLLKVPVTLAVLHQVTACLLLGAAVTVNFFISVPPETS